MPSTAVLLAALLLAASRITGAMDLHSEERKAHRALEPTDAESGPGESEIDERRKLEALEKLKEALGILGTGGDDTAPPQFMTELYNTVTDAEGYTKARNPFGAKIVRSFVEKAAEDPSAGVYAFNLSGLELNESILEAELHLYRKRSLAGLTHPSVLSSPYYVIRVYQVLPDKSLDEPDLHRLLNVHYVGAYGFGWQVFNVKLAVLSWLSEESPNLGLLVAATTIFGDVVRLEFVRRGREPVEKQPILVLFDDDAITSTPVEPREVGLAKRRSKRHGAGQPEVAGYVDRGWPDRYRREKKRRRAEKRRKAHGFVPKQRSLEQTITSMDVYERAVLREKLGDKEAPRRQLEGKSSRGKREAREEEGKCREEPEPCARTELRVNLRDIGMGVIAPEIYDAYQCRGHCKSPLSQDQKPTNHATIQGIINKMNLAPEQDVREPCCVPVSLSSISILYHDEERDGVVLKSYTDMAVVSCGCR
ncbi:bone morphogenetic protein 4-like [Copidosoma floridanum]|uniref:bone morphogenetic protein 4-like n=1 Tax=Copidosoma floridanum TaxID=29053 RepID=UPI0006C986EB|nr:bone morphogenetic protein 4-like [Copidosoma floridanum]